MFNLITSMDWSDCWMLGWIIKFSMTSICVPSSAEKYLYTCGVASSISFFKNPLKFIWVYLSCYFLFILKKSILNNFIYLRYFWEPPEIRPLKTTLRQSLYNPLSTPWWSLVILGPLLGGYWADLGRLFGGHGWVLGGLIRDLRWILQPVLQ